MVAIGKSEVLKMKSIAIFNNKGGVGKTTLTYHVASAFAALGHRTLLVDLDPQSNLTLFGYTPEELEEVWAEEESFVEDFDRAALAHKNLPTLLSHTHSTHLLLKPTEDGISEPDILAPPRWLVQNALGLLPGRLSLHMFEDRIASRWSDIYRGDPLALRTLTRIRKLCHEYAEKHGFEYVFMDTSPSLGVLNKVIISTCDGVVVPCLPDMFSLYGLKNIGRALANWRTEFSTLELVLTENKRRDFPRRFVQFLGYTIYNAVKRTGNNDLNLAQAHYNYAKRLPGTVIKCIPLETRSHLGDDVVSSPIGNNAVMHTHNTLPIMAQKYRTPIWNVPSVQLDKDDAGTIKGNRAQYESTFSGYTAFAQDLLHRLNALDEKE